MQFILLYPMELLLSKKEYLHIKYRIESYPVSTLRILVKNHKNYYNNSAYLSRLIVPVQSFTIRNSELMYFITKELFIRNKIVIDEFTIL